MVSFLDDAVAYVKSMNMREILGQLVTVGLVLASALILWKAMMIVTDTESPIVVVLSESMAPGFHRGDLLFLSMNDKPVRAGETIVFKVKGKDIPIVHRAITVLTKGDNNVHADRFLYDSQFRVMFIGREDVIGRAWGFLPYIGIVTIWMNEFPMFKVLLIATLGIIAFFVEKSE